MTISFLEILQSFRVNSLIFVPVQFGVVETL